MNRVGVALTPQAAAGPNSSHVQATKIISPVTGVMVPSRLSTSHGRNQKCSSIGSRPERSLYQRVTVGVVSAVARWRHGRSPFSRVGWNRSAQFSFSGFPHRELGRMLPVSKMLPDESTSPCVTNVFSRRRIRMNMVFPFFTIRDSSMTLSRLANESHYGVALEAHHQTAPYEGEQKHTGKSKLQRVRLPETSRPIPKGFFPFYCGAFVG